MTIIIPGPDYISNNARNKGEIKDALEEIRTGLETVDINADQNTTDIAALQSDVSNLETIDIVNIEADIVDLQSDASNHDIDIGALQTKTTAMWSGGNSYPEFTIASGLITPTVALFTLDTEGDAAIDTLTNIDYTNLPNGSAIIFSIEDASREVIITHEAGGDGQISLNSGSYITLNSTSQFISLVRKDTNWVEISNLFTLLNDINGNGFTISNAKFQDTTEVTQTLGTITTATDIDLSLGGAVTCTIGADLTFSFSNVPSTDTSILSMTVTNGGAYTITWPGSIVWDTGSAPVLQAAGTDIITFMTNGGTIWRATRFWREL